MQYEQDFLGSSSARAELEPRKFCSAEHGRTMCSFWAGPGPAWMAFLVIWSIFRPGSEFLAHFPKMVKNELFGHF